MESYYDNDPSLSRLPRMNFKGYKFIVLENAQHGFQEQSLKKNEQSLDMLKRLECRYSLRYCMLKALHLVWKMVFV